MDDNLRRINYGLDESVRKSSGPVLVSVGSRHNYLPPNPFIGVHGAEYIGERQHRKFSQINTPMHAFLISPDEPFLLSIQSSKIIEKDLSFTFSAYCDVQAEEPVFIKVYLSSEEEIRGDNWKVTNSLTRFETSHSFSDAPDRIEVKIKGCISSSDFSHPIELRFAIAMVEEGLFAGSSPIIGETPYAFRDGCQLSHPRSGHFPKNDTGTIFVHFMPEWTGPQIAANAKAYLIDCVSDDHMNAFSIFCDGSNYGKITGIIVDQGKEQIIHTDIVPVKNITYSVVLRWMSGIADVIVNGRLSGSLECITLPNSNQLGDRIYLGCTSRSAYFSSFSTLPFFSIFSGWLSDEQIKATCYENDSVNFAHFENDWRKVVNSPGLQYFTNESWYFTFANFLLLLPRVWQQSPPTWLTGESIDEAHCRDEIHRYLTLRDLNSIPEYHTYEGRTDLFVNDKNIEELSLRIEFKVWGRHDYKEVPNKPLKYFVGDECAGIVIMINPNKRKSINQEYLVNVTNSNTNCIQIVDTPFGSDASPFHFASIHEADDGSTVEILHIVINRQGPFAVR